MKIQLETGNSVEVTKVGDGFDCHLRTPEGRTIATVFVEKTDDLFPRAEEWYRAGGGRFTTDSRESLVGARV